VRQRNSRWAFGHIDLHFFLSTKLDQKMSNRLDDFCATDEPRRAVIKRLKKAGFELVNAAGKHDKWSIQAASGCRCRGTG
jgi:hypothetical protein